MLFKNIFTKEIQKSKPDFIIERKINLHNDVSKVYELVNWTASFESDIDMKIGARFCIDAKSYLFVINSIDFKRNDISLKIIAKTDEERERFIREVENFT